MTQLNIKNLEACFKAAKAQNKKYIGVKILITGFDAEEIIINPSDNFEKKLQCYKIAYNSRLIFNATDKIRITGFTYGDSFEEIQKNLHV